MRQPDPAKQGGDDPIPTRGSLLKRLRNWEDQESWRAFFDTYWRLIYNFSIRSGLTHEEAQETVQDTVVAVARSIGRFEYEPRVCRFKSWLLSVTRSKIANQLARRARQPAGWTDPASGQSEETPLLNRLPDERTDPLENTWDEEWQKNLMDTAIQRVKSRVSIEQFQMFDLFVLKGWPAGEVARTLGVTLGHIYVAKHRVSKLIRKEIQALESRTL